ncbi:MAG: PD40 domain-containing protein, partial [Acidobacteria bacterium]|nr:PD40 domain-containing protein [Acidobacteriota bacterium]
MTTRPYGSWSSPITAESIVAGSVSIGEVAVGATGLWWSEGRPAEAGRVQLVRMSAAGSPIDVLPEGFGARTRVHEYGGGSWWLHGDDVVFANLADQRLYRLPEGSHTPMALTPAPAVDHGDRYADLRFSADGRWVVCVRERHDAEGEPINEIVAVRTRPRGEPAEPVVLVSGPDFVAAPRVSPDGTMLCWFSWHHPDMPWDGTELHVARLIVEPRNSGTIALGASAVLAGSRSEAITEPDWHPDGSL